MDIFTFETYALVFLTAHARTLVSSLVARYDAVPTREVFLEVRAFVGYEEKMYGCKLYCLCVRLHQCYLLRHCVCACCA